VSRMASASTSFALLGLVFSTHAGKERTGHLISRSTSAAVTSHLPSLTRSTRYNDCFAKRLRGLLHDGALACTRLR
jgi:hypothetical protein